jgi:hypothetical protein
MECGLITEDSFGSEIFIHLMSSKEVTAKRVGNFFVLASYILQQLAPYVLNFKHFHRIVCVIVGQVWLVCLDCKQKLLKHHLTGATVSACLPELFPLQMHPI